MIKYLCRKLDKSLSHVSTPGALEPHPKIQPLYHPDQNVYISLLWVFFLFYLVLRPRLLLPFYSLCMTLFSFKKQWILSMSLGKRDNLSAPTDEWTKKIHSISIQLNITCPKRNEVSIHATSWMNLKTVG